MLIMIYAVQKKRKELYQLRISFLGLAQIDPSILTSRRGGKKTATGVYTQYRTVTNNEGEAEFHVKHRFTPLSAKLKESLAGGLATQEAEAYQHKAERQKTMGIFTRAMLHLELKSDLPNVLKAFSIVKHLF